MTVTLAWNIRRIFTLGQFWYSGSVIACVCLPVRARISHEIFRMITHDPFKLGSPNLDQMCYKTLIKIPIAL